MMLALVLALSTAPSIASSDAKLLSIQKEACGVYKIFSHQRDVLHNYAHKDTYTDEDKLRIKFAMSTMNSEQKRLLVLSDRFFKLSSQELSLKSCPKD